MRWGSFLRSVMQLFEGDSPLPGENSPLPGPGELPDWILALVLSVTIPGFFLNLFSFAARFKSEIRRPLSRHMNYIQHLTDSITCLLTPLILLLPGPLPGHLLSVLLAVSTWSRLLTFLGKTCSATCTFGYHRLTTVYLDRYSTKRVN